MKTEEEQWAIIELETIRLISANANYKSAMRLLVKAYENGGNMRLAVGKVKKSLERWS